MAHPLCLQEMWCCLGIMPINFGWILNCPQDDTDYKHSRPRLASSSSLWNAKQKKTKKQILWHCVTDWKTSQCVAKRRNNTEEMHRTHNNYHNFIFTEAHILSFVKVFQTETQETAVSIGTHRVIRTHCRWARWRITLVNIITACPAFPSCLADTCPCGAVAWDGVECVAHAHLRTPCSVRSLGACWKKSSQS